METRQSSRAHACSHSVLLRGVVGTGGGESAASECDTASNDSLAPAADAASSARSGERRAIGSSADNRAAVASATRECGDTVAGNGDAAAVGAGRRARPELTVDGSGSTTAEFSARSMRSAARKCDWCKIRIEGSICGWEGASCVLNA